MIFAQTDPTGVIANVAAQTEAAAAAEPHSLKEGLEQLKNFSFEDFINGMAERLVNFAIDIAIAIGVFYLGKFIIRRIYKIVESILLRRNVDHSLCTFILSFVKIVLYFILIVTVIGIIGIETSSFLAIFASAGVAIGMALSGTLQNFAGGVLILFLKPYKIGDYIEAQGYAGTVREIQIFHTIITTYDNKAIIIPNGGLSTSSINNWSREDYRRVEWSVAISYGDDVSTARQAILDLFDDDHRIIKQLEEPTIDHAEDSDGDAENSRKAEAEKPAKRPNAFMRLFGNRRKVREAIEKWEDKRDTAIKALRPRVTQAPSVTVNSLGDSSVNLVARAWVRSENYWAVFYDYNERIYNELPNRGIHFPFPQIDVHMRS